MRVPSNGDFNSLKMYPLYVAIAPTCFGGRDEVATDSILKNEMKLIKNSHSCPQRHAFRRIFKPQLTAAQMFSSANGI